MWTSIFLGLFVLASVGFIIVYRRQQEQIAMLKRAREKVELEEKRVFEFFHGLGEAFSADSRRNDLPRLIVEGAMTVLNANGGALYMSNADSTALVMSHLSKNCPPLIDVSSLTRQAGGATGASGALDTYQRLHAIARGEGLIGSAWRDGEPLLVTGSDPRLSGLRNDGLVTDSLMLCPLTYANHKLSMLVMVKVPGTEPFSTSDLAVFKAISEQAAFALYNATVHSEAEEKSGSTPTSRSPRKFSAFCCRPSRRRCKISRSPA